jgi:hypothetical protein
MPAGMIEQSIVRQSWSKSSFDCLHSWIDEEIERFIEAPYRESGGKIEYDEVIDQLPVGDPWRVALAFIKPLLEGKLSDNR